MSETEGFKMESDLWYRQYSEDFERHATAIGYLCREFAQLDFKMTMLVEELLSLPRDVARAILELSSAFNKNVDCLTRVCRAHPPNTLWLDRFDSLVPCLTSLGTDRNRVIHDNWVSGHPSGVPVRLDGRFKYAQSKPNESRSVQPYALRPVELVEIWDITYRVTLAEHDLHSLWRSIGPCRRDKHLTPPELTLLGYVGSPQQRQHLTPRKAPANPPRS